MQRLFKLTIVLLMSIQAFVCAENGYDTNFIDLIEIVYGDGYLSQGGSEMVERMFDKIDLKGKKILDLGCGIGGPALYLAKNYDVTVVGIDPDTAMIQQSQSTLKKLLANSNTPLKGSVQFIKMENPLTLQQFSDSSFDVVTSKEAILHVPIDHKQNYFQEIFRVLKKGGQIVILDWQHKSSNYSDEVKAMMEMDGVPFHLITPKEYAQIVTKAGFSIVIIDDLTNIFEKQSDQDLTTIDTNQNQIIDQFGKETYEYARRSWKIQGQAFKDRELLVGLIKAVKN